jgi:sulfonate transport system substrate-binding protein
LPPVELSSLTRRHAILAAGASLALAACGRGKGSAQVLRVGSQKGGTKALVLASGVLEGVPYRIEWSDFPAAQNLLEAIASGAVDVGLAGDAPFQFAYQAGSPVRAVAAMAATRDTPEGALAILVPARSPAHGITDLAGKRIATTRGSIGHFLILRALQEAGLASDAARIVFLTPSDSKAALQTGAIDAWATWAPYTVAALAGAIAEKRTQLVDFLGREARALDWANGHRADYAKVLAQETGLPMAIALATVERNTRQRVALDATAIGAQQVVLDTFRKAGDVKAPLPLDKAFVALG